MQKIRASLLTSLLILAIACGPKAVSDQTLTTDIQAKLYANDATRAANVKVAVTNGVVTLSGDVPNSDVALQAMTIANGTPGLKSVDNQMKVAESAASASPAPPPSGPAAPAPVQNLSTPVPAPAPDARRSEEEKLAAEHRRHEEMTHHEPDREAPPAPPQPVTITIPAGQQISVRMIDAIDTKQDHEGQTFRASLSSPITDGDRVVVPTGASASVLLAQSRSAGRIKGNSELELRLTSITYHGEEVRVSTGVYEAKGGARGKQTAVRTGLGAAAGALIGGLAGGGKGAGIGAAAGAGAGAGFQLLTHGQQVKVPSETEINFTLDAPLNLTR